MVVYKNKYQIQIPHAIWPLQCHWYYAIAILLSHLTFNQGVHKTPRPTDSIIVSLFMSFLSSVLISHPSPPPPQLEQRKELLAVVVAEALAAVLQLQWPADLAKKEVLVALAKKEALAALVEMLPPYESRIQDLKPTVEVYVDYAD